MGPESASPRWRARLSRTDYKWHRVEVDGPAPALIEENPAVRAAALSLIGEQADKYVTPIALVKEREHARAIAALPRVAQALQRAIDKTTGWEQEAMDALDEMEGR